MFGRAATAAGGAAAAGSAASARASASRSDFHGKPPHPPVAMPSPGPWLTLDGASEGLAKKVPRRSRAAEGRGGWNASGSLVARLLARVPNRDATSPAPRSGPGLPVTRALGSSPPTRLLRSVPAVAAGRAGGSERSEMPTRASAPAREPLPSRRCGGAPSRCGCGGGRRGRCSGSRPPGRPGERVVEEGEEVSSASETRENCWPGHPARARGCRAPGPPRRRGRRARGGLHDDADAAGRGGREVLRERGVRPGKRSARTISRALPSIARALSRTWSRDRRCRPARRRRLRSCPASAARAASAFLAGTALEVARSSSGGDRPDGRLPPSST